MSDRSVLIAHSDDSDAYREQAFRTMEAYERQLARAGERGARQLAILRLAGLFDWPVDPGSLAALRRAPAITGLTEPIVGIPEDDWRRAVARLRVHGLLSEPPAPGSIDAHPLVREYFAARLREERPEVWREAHARIYEHLAESAEYQPDTLEGLEPLFQAVVHGCHAQRHQEACDLVYYERIHRGQYFATAKLGAYGRDLDAVGCFFDERWSRVSPLLRPADQAWLLAVAAHDLRACGRSSEALPPLLAALAMRIEQEDWENAAICAGNVAELRLTLGEVEAAIAAAEEGVRHADRSRSEAERRDNRSTLADALHQAGRCDEALALFREAEAIHAGSRPTYPLLHSLASCWYADLLLDQVERDAWRATMAGRTAASPGWTAHAVMPREVEQRILRTLAWAEEQGWLLDIAAHHVVLGRIALYRELLPTSAETSPAGVPHLETAVDGLRRAGMAHQLPLGLMSRAWQRSLDGDSADAVADLDEAWQVAERGSMRLHIADIHLYRARLFHTVKPYSWESPHADRAAARALIEQCGYWRRKEELEDAEEAAKSW